MRQVLSALAAAGERGIVHRDIKPENIMITRRGEAKVADFGLAQLQGGERLYLTQEGVTMGTPLYMSPEQVQGRPVDQRTDLYSFGITCYHMLAGRPPFVGDNPVAVAFKHVSEKPEPLAGIRPDVPKVVCEVISRLMAREPVDRYQDAQIALNDVKRIAKALKTGEDINVNETGLVTISGQMPRAGVWLPLLCVVSAVLAAGVGWYVRPRIPQPSVNVLSTTIPELPTAREQYLHAMLLVDNIDAFLAVENYHRNDRLWVNRAHEQLMLLYLKDYARYSAEAEQQRRLLERLGGEDQRLYTEAQLSEAALLAYSRKYADAQRKLKLIDRANLQKLSRSWQELEADLQRLISQQTQAS
jgi:serine/threonine-protein kinase